MQCLGHALCSWEGGRVFASLSCGHELIIGDIRVIESKSPNSIQLKCTVGRVKRAKCENVSAVPIPVPPCNQVQPTLLTVRRLVDTCGMLWQMIGTYPVARIIGLPTLSFWLSHWPDGRRDISLCTGHVRPSPFWGNWFWHAKCRLTGLQIPGMDNGPVRLRPCHSQVPTPMSTRVGDFESVLFCWLLSRTYIRES